MRILVLFLTLLVQVPLRAQVPTITTQPATQTVSGGVAVTFAVGISGVGPFTYQWQFDGTNLPNGIITTVAGNGTNGYSGDGGKATNANLSQVWVVAVDASDNLFIADPWNNRIREVSTNGIITTVAGGGVGGDGGVATSAGLNFPYGVALDSSGNLFISDYDGYRIREVTTSGVITTVAGNGTGGYSGDGGAATNANLSEPSGMAVDATGNLFFADQGNSRIREVGTNAIITTVAGTGTRGYSGDGGAATNASLYVPSGVAVDAAGNLFIADTYNHRIREVSTNGIITTVAGNGQQSYSGDNGAATSASLNYPYGVAVDAFGNLFIADEYNNRIREVSTNGIITTVAGNGTNGYSGDGAAATNASLNDPTGMAVDASGNLFVADTYNSRIRRVTNTQGPALALNNVTAANAGNYQVVVTGSGGSVTSNVAMLNLFPTIYQQPQSQSVARGGTAVFSVTADGTTQLAYQWLFNGGALAGETNTTLTLPAVTTNNAGNYSVVITNAYGSVTSSPAAVLTVNLPPSITLEPASQTVLAGTYATFAVGATGAGPFTYQWQFNGTNLPNGIIMTVAGNGTTNFSGDGGAATNATLSAPYGVVVDASGDLFIADHVNNRIREVSTKGIITTVAGDGMTNFLSDGGAATNASVWYPTAVAVDASGNLFIADWGNNRIREVSTNGIITTVAGGGVGGDGSPATNASLNGPQGVAVDSSGNLFISDTYNNRIREVSVDGFITTVAGSGWYGSSGDGGPATNANIAWPFGVAVSAPGNLFIAEYYYFREILEVSTNGIITKIAGNGTEGYSGDGGAATNAALNGPYGMAVDAFGNLFIADFDNNRIRELSTNGIITTVAGNGTNGYSGDGGAATNARLARPLGVAMDASGNLFVADTYNSRIRRVTNTRGPALGLPNVSGANVGNYQVVVTGSGGSVTSSVAVLNLFPTISQQPQSQTLTSGQTAAFSVTADGTAPLAYQWLFNGDALAGETNTILTVSAVTTNNAGNYSVVITNAYGSVTSTPPAVLTVNSPPSITSQPASREVWAGGNLTFAVGATGVGPFTYQWQFNGTNLPLGIITTVAGYGNSGYSGDGGPATNARLVDFGVAVDASGNLFIADEQDRRIRKVSTNGIITTVAGNGNSGYSGDGGAATNAKLGRPYDVAVDASGNLFIADTTNQRIRKVSTNGIITTIAGGGTNYPGNGGAATNAALFYPIGVAADASGNLLLVDSYNFLALKVSANGIITTVAGNGTEGYSGDGGAATNASLDHPTGVAVDASGNVFIADWINNGIREVSTNGIITTVAGNGTQGYSGDGGAATNASLSAPADVAVDSFGNLFISDHGNNCIREVDTNGIITTVAGSGTGGYSGDGGAATTAKLFSPWGVAVDAFDNLFIADSSRIRKVTSIPGPVLNLTNVTAANAGNYQVVVSGPGGSVTSSVATLIVATSPLIYGTVLNTDGSVTLSLVSRPNSTNVVQCATNLSPPVLWQSVSTNVAGGDGNWQFTDSNAANYQTRFYRSLMP